MAELIKLPTVPLDDTLYNAVLVNDLVIAAARVVLHYAFRECVKIATAPSNVTLGVAMNCADAIRALEFTHGIGEAKP